MDTLESRELAGTEGLTDAPLFWSPDSRFIAFDGNGKLRKIDAAGGPPQTICSTPGAVVGGSWNRKGVILFGIYNTAGIQRVSAAGGAPSPATAMNAARKDTSHVFPLLLPDGRHFLYLVNSAIPENRGIYVGSLDSKPDRQAPTRLLATAFGPGFVSLGGEKGQLLFQRDGALLAQPFDLRRLETGGEASPVAGQLGPGSLNFGDFAASENGTLVYRAAAGGNGEMSQTPFTIVQNWMSVVPR